MRMIPRSAYPLCRGRLKGVDTMKYVSTRGLAPELDFVGATLAGVAKDGGLYVPEHVPRFTEQQLGRLHNMSHAARCAAILWIFAEGAGLDRDEFRKLVKAGFGDQWDDPTIAPVKHLEDDLYVLELFHGPTFSFKDQALQPLGIVQPAFLKMRGESIVLVVATSGDTGPAACESFKAKPNTELFVLFPEHGTSEEQRWQMTNVQDDNVHCMAIRGPFDACQDLVKALGRPSVNSINWFRIAAQIGYYFTAASSVIRRTGAKEVSFTVPSANFGNIYGGTLAKRLGAPIRNLIVATNENDMLVDFVNRGIYRPRDTIVTSSYSQDIGKSSNGERLTYDSVKDPAEVRRLYNEDLPKNGSYSIDPSFMRELGLFASSTDTETRHRTMRRVREELGYEMDPHSANGYAVAVGLQEEGVPMIVHATASAAKFKREYELATGQLPTIPERLAKLSGASERVVTLDNNLGAVSHYIEHVLERRRAA